MSRFARTAAPLALVAALLAGCTGTSGDDTASTGAASDEAAAGTVAPEQAVPDAEDAATTSALGRAQLAGSAVVRNAELDVRVDDVRAAADTAGRLVREAGGQVAAERTDASRGGDVASAELRLRVPPERFDELLGRLADLGEERSRTSSTEPVGDQLVDLQSRLATQRASVARVQALLAEADDLAQVVQIEAELTRRTADLESLQARLAALQDTVELSTVVLRLDTSGVVDDAAPAGFLSGLSGGWSALLASLTVLATVAGAVLPFLPLLAVALWLLARSRRRRPVSGVAA